MITSDGLALIPLRESDADRLAGFLDDPVLRQWLRAEDVSGLRDHFRRWESGAPPDGPVSWLNWIAVSPGDHRALGWVQATVSGSAAVIAYAVLPLERGHGVATEAVRAITRWLYEQPGITTVEANIDPENRASQSVAVKAGFAPAGRMRAGDEVWQAASGDDVASAPA